MKFHPLLFLFSAMTCLLTACSDPSDKVPKSAAVDPVAATSNAPAQITPAAGKDYVIGGDSTINFIGSKVTGSHNGGFRKFSGTIKVDNGKIVGHPEIKIDMSSTWADNEKLTGHLKSGDFFAVDQHPEAKFAVTSIEEGLSGGPHKVTGNLTLHGVTKSVSFPAQIRVENEMLTVQSQFAINRKDFNINYPGKQDDLIRDHVVIKLDLKASPTFPKVTDQASR